MSTTTTPEALKTPELLSVIASHVDSRYARVSLLRVSQSWFSAAVSFVWSDLKSPLHLLQLIPGTVVQESAGSVIDGKCVLTLPSYAEADFTRFDVYAPHVRRLWVRSAFYKISKWDTLVSRSRIRPLLPHLSSLNILQMPQHQSDSLTNEFLWMLVFLNPSLKSVHLRPELGIWASAISSTGFRSLLDTISRTCPNVRSLCLPSIRSDADEEHQLLHILPTQSINQCFQSFSGLRELETGLWIFQTDLIREIGALTQLDHLILYPEQGGMELPEHLPIDEDAFPALRKLTLFFIDWADVGTLLEYPLLAHNIVSFEITCLLEGPSPTWNGAQVFFLLGNMPNLCELGIIFDDSVGLHYLDVEEFLNVLSQLPLRTVRLTGAQFTTLSTVPLDTIFPAVTDLGLPQQKADLHELSRFATMPCLKHLAIAFSDWYGKTDWLFLNDSCCPSFEILEMTVKPSRDGQNLPELYPRSYTHTAANRLLQMFPNLKRIIWPSMDQKSYEYQRLCLLNTQIVVLRQWNSARDRIIRELGQDVANQLMPDDNFLARALEPIV